MRVKPPRKNSRPTSVGNPRNVFPASLPGCSFRYHGKVHLLLISMLLALLIGSVNARTNIKNVNNKAEFDSAWTTFLKNENKNKKKQNKNKI